MPTLGGKPSNRYGCVQYGELRSSDDRRKHLNLLLDDYVNALPTIYNKDTIGPGTGSKQEATDIEAEMIKATRAAGICEMGNVDTSRDFQSVYTEGGVPSRETAAKVNNKRTPSGNFFSTTNPALMREEPPAMHGGDYLTKSAMTQSGYITGAAKDRRKSLDAPAAFQGKGGKFATSMTKENALATEYDKPTQEDMLSRSWVQPWQTGDRTKGKAMARAICSQRTPIGAFANFDLAKAPK